MTTNAAEEQERSLFVLAGIGGGSGGAAAADLLTLRTLRIGRRRDYNVVVSK